MTVQELDRYRPIPHGGAQQLVALIVLPVLFYVVVGWVLQTINLPDALRSSTPVVSAVVCFVTGILVNMRVDGRFNPVVWLRDYWQRNVVGYSLWVHRCASDQIVSQPNDRWFKDHRGCMTGYPHQPCRVCGSERFLVLPLGGWKSKWGYIAECQEVKYFRGWRVHLIRISEDQTIWMFLAKGSEQLVLTAQAALQLLSRWENSGLGLGGRAHWLLKYEAIATQRSKDALAVIDGAIAKIAATDRLRCTKEGKRLLKWLQEERGKLLQTDGQPQEQPKTAAASAAAAS